MNFKNVVVAGGGVLGSQIAYQAAYCGFNVTIWLRSEGSITRTQPKLQRAHDNYASDLKIMCTPDGKRPGVWAPGLADRETFDYDACVDANEKAFNGIKLELDMAKALADADLLIEAVAEDPESKIEFYKAAAPLMPERTVIATNSSTLLPSSFAQYTGRPEKFLAMHFANNIWRRNTAEIMRHDGTDMQYYDQVVDFAKAIRMVPLCLYKEQPGYILNSLLVPFMYNGLELLVNEISDPATIDLTWRLGLGAPKGPFEIIDVIGVVTMYNIYSMYPDAGDPTSTTAIICAKLKEMIDANKLGISTGEGFYKYDK